MEKKAILLVSFGSSHIDTREKTYLSLKRKVEEAFSEYEVREAYLSEMIIRILKKKQNLEMDNPAQALDRLKADGFTDVIILPTLITNGIEYDRLTRMAMEAEKDFNSIYLGMGLLSEESDLEEVIRILDSEYKISENKDTAFVFMGHGSEHPISAIYAAMDYRLKHSGLTNAFIGAVEGYPDVDMVVDDVKASGFCRAVVAPMMMVAGDHAKNDMAGDDDSWKAKLEKAGLETEAVIRGLGEIGAVQDLMLRHIREAIANKQ